MSSAIPITDHGERRRWVEGNHGRPARVDGTGRGGGRSNKLVSRQ